MDSGVSPCQEVGGSEGSKPVHGMPGSSGSDGSKSVQGIPGSSGSDGSKSVQGIPGSSGSDGSKSVHGIPGSSGSDGSKPVQGIPGSLSGSSKSKASLKFNDRLPYELTLYPSPDSAVTKLKIMNAL